MITCSPSSPAIPLLPPLLLLLAATLPSTTPPTLAATFKLNLRGSRAWLSPSVWQSPLHDWRLSASRLVTTAAENHYLALLPLAVAPPPPPKAATRILTASFNARLHPPPPRRGRRAPYARPAGAVAFGLGFARRGRGRRIWNDYRAVAVRPAESLNVMVYADGRLQVAGKRAEPSYSLRKAILAGDLIEVTVSVTQHLARATIEMTASARRKSYFIRDDLPVRLIAGHVALLAEGPQRNVSHTSPYFKLSFQPPVFKGSAVRVFKNREFGPILWTQYTISDGTLRLQAQLAPLHVRRVVYLYTKPYATPGRKFALTAARKMDLDSHTASFTVRKWGVNSSVSYQVRLFWDGRWRRWGGKIRRAPSPSRKRPFAMAAFSCDEGYTFPNARLVAATVRHNPDMLLFLGDQFYEYAFAYRRAYRSTPFRVGMMDFLRKFYTFGWVWRRLMAERPAVILPDDHDVFQGNLFGAGGVAMKLKHDYDIEGARGGYAMSGRWVRAVERCHVGHLPPSKDRRVLPHGISPWYTRIRYAGMDIAVIEDRKFKAAPLAMSPKMMHDMKGGGADLLGAQQERFVSSWADDWKDAEIKIVLSATIFASLSTHRGSKFRRMKSFADSGSWPLRARQRAMKHFARSGALMLHGDQHLGLFAKLGIKAPGDANYAFMVPGSANGFPRAWWPGLKKAEKPKKGDNFTGDFVDDAGCPTRVLAVGNPQPWSSSLDWRKVDPDEVAYRKGSGFGVVKVDRRRRKAQVNLFRAGAKKMGEQFQGFPVTVSLGRRA